MRKHHQTDSPASSSPRSRQRLRDLTEGSVAQHLVRLTIPSIGGMLAITIFNLTDTFFVARLGTDALAAMGFTFPVVLVIGSLSIGMATGAGAVLARAMGSNDHHLMNRAATDGILLAILMVIVVSAAGVLTLDPVFRALGATENTLPLVKEYMRIWYLGSVAVIMPPVGDSSMRAMGDMTRPLIVMLVCAVLNLILDPILIFGLFGFPAMGIASASLATVISRVAGMVTTLSFVHFHYRLIDFRYDGVRELLLSWKRILQTGLPVALVRLMPQVLRAVLTRLAAGLGGVTAVAAIAAGTRIESFPMVLGMAVGMAVIPVVGQNWGAGKLDRVERTRRLLNRIAIVYGLLMLVVMLFAARPLAGIFSDVPEVIAYARWYLIIMMISGIGLNQSNWTSQSLTAAGRPRPVVIINTVGIVGIIIPLTVAGAHLFGFVGMLAGLAVGQLVMGVLAMMLGRRELEDREALLAH